MSSRGMARSRSYKSPPRRRALAEPVRRIGIVWCALVVIAALIVSCSSSSRPIATGALLSTSDLPGYTQTVPGGRCDFVPIGGAERFAVDDCQGTGFVTDAAMSGEGR